MIKDNKQITTLNQLTQLSLSSYPFTKESNRSHPAHLESYLKVSIKAIQTKKIWDKEEIYFSK